MHNNSDKFDHLIALAATKCIEQEAQELNALDTSNVAFDSSYYRKRNRSISKCKLKSTLKFTKTLVIRVAVAMMIMITLGCVLIGCIPEWRQAIYEAIVEWYDNFFAVRYEDPDGKEKETTYVEETTTVAVPVLNAPTLIENIRKPTDLPEEMWEDIVINNTNQVIVDYYIEDEYQFSFTQTVLEPNDKYVDTEDADIAYIEINGNDATVVEHRSQNDKYIVWSDKEYVYQITSNTLDVNDLITYARSVK